MAAKIRRLYDIANVLSSLELIKKVHVTEDKGRKPAFKWTGPEDLPSPKGECDLSDLFRILFGLMVFILRNVHVFTSHIIYCSWLCLQIRGPPLHHQHRSLWSLVPLLITVLKISFPPPEQSEVLPATIP